SLVYLSCLSFSLSLSLSLCRLLSTYAVDNKGVGRTAYLLAGGQCVVLLGLMSLVWSSAGVLQQVQR
ncbi:hypothetical protein GQ607_016523, partial [Colletotrichum asianum]